MAERSSELNEEMTTRTDKIEALSKADETSDNVYLESRQTDTSPDIEISDEDAEEVTEDTEQIRAQIEETRSNLGETIDAIQERLSISNITGQVKEEVSDYVSSTFQTAKDSIYGATLGKVGNIMNYLNKGFDEVGDQKMVVAARQNPLAISLIGLGLGMLLVNGFKKKRPNYRYDADYDRNNYDVDDYDRDTDYDRREFSTSDRTSRFETYQNKGRDIAGQTYKGVSNVAGQAYEGVSGAASKVGSSVTDAAGKVSESVGSAANQAYKQVGNLGTKAKDVAGSAQDQYEHHMEENPLAVGAVALALGAAVGLSIPSTRIENHYMGEARANLMEKASETAREAIDKVQQVAGEVKQTVQDQVKDKGFDAQDNKSQGFKTGGINNQDRKL